MSALYTTAAGVTVHVDAPYNTTKAAPTTPSMAASTTPRVNFVTLGLPDLTTPVPPHQPSAISPLEEELSCPLTEPAPELSRQRTSSDQSDVSLPGRVDGPFYMIRQTFLGSPDGAAFIGTPDGQHVASSPAMGRRSPTKRPLPPPSHLELLLVTNSCAQVAVTSATGPQLPWAACEANAISREFPWATLRTDLTAQDLNQMLMETPARRLHLIAHMDGSNVLWTATDGHESTVPMDALAGILADVEEMELLFLDGCESLALATKVQQLASASPTRLEPTTSGQRYHICAHNQRATLSTTSAGPRSRRERLLAPHPGPPHDDRAHRDRHAARPTCARRHAHSGRGAQPACGLLLDPGR